VKIDTFKIFCTIYEEKSISQASKLLHISQPAMSKQIKLIEGYFGCQLFDRTPHGILATPFGEIFYEHARKIISTFNKLEEALVEAKSSHFPPLRVGASNTVGNYPLPCSFWLFKEKYPLTKVSLEIDNSNATINKLRQGEVDLIIVEHFPFCGEFNCKKCGQDELVVVTPYMEPWIDKDIITLEELTKHPLIMREEGSGIRAIWGEYLNKSDFSLQDFKLIAEMGSISSIKASVAEGFGISLLPTGAIRKEIYTKILKALPLQDPPIDFNYTIAWSKNSPMNQSQKMFIDFIMSEEKGFC